MKKVLITGTAGFIGLHLANKVAGEGNQVVGLDSINDYYDVNLKYDRLHEQGIDKNEIKYNKIVKGDAQISFIKLQLEDKENIMRLFEKEEFDEVVHLAAQAGVGYSLSNPDAYIDSNIVGFFNILEACRKYRVKHLVFASSSSVYGLNKQIPFSESHHTDHPISLYAATKKADEMMAHCYAHLYDIPVTGLRFFTVYGPWGRPDMALFLFPKSIIEGKPIKVFNNGDMLRDFTYIDDIVNGVAALLKVPPKRNENYDHHSPVPHKSSAAYQVLNIGNNNPANLMDFVHLIEKELNIKADVNLLPMQPGDVKETYADVSELINQTGYSPDTPIEEGVKQFVNWYRSYYSIE